MSGTALRDEEYDWLNAEGEYTREKIERIKGDVELLLSRLETAPTKLVDLGKFDRTGITYMTKSGKPKWKKFTLKLTGDQLVFFDPTKPSEAHLQYELCYAHFTTVELEDVMLQRQQQTNMKVCKKRLNVITHGAVITLTFDSDDEAAEWWAFVKKVLRAKFTKPELIQKEEARRALEPLLQEQEKILWARHDTIVKALANSGFWSGKEKKMHEGYLFQSRGKRRPKKFYMVLFKDYIYFFKPHERVSPNEKPADMIALRFVSGVAFENDSNKIFHITTPLRKIVLEGKHEVGVFEWVKAIVDQVRKAEGGLPGVQLPELDESKLKVSDKGYVYSKPLLGKMSIVAKFADRSEAHKLRKEETNTFGRSASCQVRLRDDHYVSRQHCKIVLEGNVPYLVDLGQSKDGTLLNGKKIKKAPLKPGDVFSIGDTSCTFNVKESASIFLQTRVEESSSSEESPKEKKKDKREKKEDKDVKDGNEEKKDLKGSKDMKGSKGSKDLKGSKGDKDLKGSKGGKGSNKTVKGDQETVGLEDL